MARNCKFTVKTLDEKALREAAGDLNNLIFKDFVYDIIIGIRSGGYIVAEMMAEQAVSKPQLLAISRQRSGTQTKSKIFGLKALLRTLPYFITDYLRIVEHKRLTSKPASQPKSFSPDIDELTILLAALREKKAAKILIVDDAVDSGATMKAVLDVVRAEANSSCVIKTAAITVTTDNPLIKPDYNLYNNVLCRMPWSFDFKG